MDTGLHQIAFGPVPSRRLGRSLGINNIPVKTCSYACVYCQVGPTTEKCIEPRRFFSTRQIVEAVGSRLEMLRARELGADYLTFVPDGEPTLDQALGETIRALAPFGIPVAVVSNATLLWREDVRSRLRAADLVSVKVDAVTETAWRRINRPHRALELDRVLRGIRDFAAEFTGTLISETMLLEGIGDSDDSLRGVADFLAEIGPHTAYLAIPTRPPSVRGVRGTDEEGLARACRLFSRRLDRVELLGSPETGPFAHTGNARDDLLAVAAVHPMREQAVRQLLAEDHADWALVEELVAAGLLAAVDFEGERFYLRPVTRRGSANAVPQ